MSLKKGKNNVAFSCMHASDREFSQVPKVNEKFDSKVEGRLALFGWAFSRESYTFMRARIWGIDN